jgi:polyhydroxybutyrate depolymerase
VAATVLLLASACSSGASSTSPSAPAAAPSPVAAGASGTVTLDDRPFELTVPAGYDEATPAALVVGLHGYTSHGAELADYLGLAERSAADGFLLALPEGTTDGRNEQFWNATEACCDFGGTDVDDSAYLAAVITTVQEQYAVDPNRVFVVGHSNGGFMALRMACDHAELVAAVVSIAGAQTDDAAACTPAKPVSVLQVHGDADDTIRYAGGSTGAGRTYPGAQATVDAWRDLDACTADPATGAPLDLDSTNPAAETTVATTSGCQDGTEVALWTIGGGGHVPAWTPDAGRTIVDWLLAHPRQG